MRNWRKVFLFACSLLFCGFLQAITVTPIEDDNSNIKRTGLPFAGTIELEPKKVQELDDEKKAVIIIKSNVTGAEVYLNSIYQGKTPCTIDNIKPGRYKLELRKTNYESVAATIQIQAGYELTYELTMKEICGEIEVKNLPSGSNVYIDNSMMYGTSKEIVIGTHTVKIRRFGYKDFIQEVEILPYKKTTVTPSFEEAPFELADFAVSRNSMNPDYSSGIGKVKVSFSVTNRETAVLKIFDSDGSMTNTYAFPEFTTWEQSYTWNGTGDDGSALSDGLYTINLECDGYTYEEFVTINREMIYPMMNPVSAGLGYGRVPALEPLGVKFTNIGFSASPCFSKNGFDSVKCDISINGAFSENFAAGGNFSVNTLGEKVSLTGTVSAMYMNTLDLGLGKLMGGLQFRYGYSYKPIEAKGTDYGAGLGGTLLAGYATDSFGITASGLILAGCVTGNVLEKETMFAANLAVTAKPFRVANFYLSGSYNSYNVVTAGAGVNTMPFGSIIMFSLGANADIFLNDGSFSSSIKAGMSVIF